jgi:hypothetical protein
MLTARLRFCDRQFAAGVNHIDTSDFEILAKMFDGRCARDQQDVGRALKKPRKRDLHGRGLE